MSRRGGLVDIFVARESFVATMPDGDIIAVKKGDLVRAGHPILARREQFFAPAADHVRFDLEQATAAPGERR